MKKTIWLLLATVSLAGLLGWAAASHHFREKQELAAATARETTEAARRKIADYFSGLVRASDEVAFDYGSQGHAPRRIVRFKVPAWNARLAGVLAESSFQPVPPALWVSIPEVIFYREGKQVLWMMLLGSTLRGGGDTLSGDFRISDAAAQAIHELFKEKGKDVTTP